MAEHGETSKAKRLKGRVLNNREGIECDCKSTWTVEIERTLRDDRGEHQENLEKLFSLGKGKCRILE